MAWSPYHWVTLNGRHDGARPGAAGRSLKAAPDRSGRRATGAFPLCPAVRHTAPVDPYTARFVVSIVMAALLVGPAAAAAKPTRQAPAQLQWEVVSRRPHDTAAFTQGLQLDPRGRLFESTGELGRSTLREVDPVTGAVLRSVALPGDQFGEGLALVADRLIQLTWRSGIATSWDVESFEPVETFAYEGEGWGLCNDGSRLILSDGSDELTFRDTQTFDVIGSVSVSLAGEPLDRLNELECVGDTVWANVWGSDRIVRIDAESGEVDGVIDLDGLLEPHPALDESRAVLNGIAYDASTDTFLVTGKHWPELIELRVAADV